MPTLTFGYNVGDGSGVNTGVGSSALSAFKNTTGSTLYVNRIDLLNVHTAISLTQITLSIYSTIEPDEPWRLLATSDPLTALTIGSNTFTFSGDPISVGPDVTIAVSMDYTPTNLTLHLDGMISTSPRLVDGRGNLEDPFNPKSYQYLILPVSIFGNTVGPGDITSIRVPEVLAESVGNADNPPIQVASVIDEPLSGGNNPPIQFPYTLTEVLHLVLPEPYMSDTPLPGFGNSVADPSIPTALNPATSALPGLGFSVHKIPMFNTNLDEAAAGNEVATSLTEFPRWQFELTYEFLEDRSGADSSLKTLLGFFLARRGRWDTWLFKDPDDYLVTEGVCGEADGVTQQFYFCRTMGEFVEPVGQVDQANTINVYKGGVLVDPADYTITMPNKIVFDVAPVSGTITADFQFFYVCRFLEDEQDYEKFVDKLWNLQTCNFRSVLQQ